MSDNVNLLKPNSHKYKESKQSEKKEVKKVVKGKVRIRKKPLGKKFAETFMSEDAQDVKSYVFFDVLVPSIKDTLAEIVKQAIDIILFGNSRRSSRKDKPYGRVSYSSYYDREDDRKSRRERNRPTRDFYDIVLDSRAEAEEVLESLRDIIDQYGSASLADYHDLCDVSGGSYTDNKYGWTDLTKASISLVRGQGFVVDLPKAILLD